jgi:hypothetical protein
VKTSFGTVTRAHRRVLIKTLLRGFEYVRVPDQAATRTSSWTHARFVQALTRLLGDMRQCRSMRNTSLLGWMATTTQPHRLEERITQKIYLIVQRQLEATGGRYETYYIENE